MSSDPVLWSATRQAGAIRTGEISSRALLEQIIARIEQFNPELNAVITSDFEQARSAATAADEAIARGDSVGPLHGLPITIKDALQTKGMRSTGGAVELKDNVPVQDAPVVKAVKDAGAIVIGKTNLPRWSGDIQAFNEMFGTTVNPWNRDRVPGGSSGGAATAVATGMTSFEIGTDIGGSIRFPSAFCGVFGHKPSFGIVPSSGYLDHKAGGSTEADVNVIGPIARYAEDLELLLDLLVRKEKPWRVDLDPPPEDVSALRVAAWLDDSFCPIDLEVHEVIDNAVAKLEASGVSVDRTARPDIDPDSASLTGMWLVGAALSQSLPDVGENLEQEMPNAGLTHREWLDTHMAREAIRAKWAEFFESFDAILMPVSFVPPFPHNQEGDFGTRTLVCNGEVRPYADIIRWTILTGMAYLPVTVPPIGLSNSGLPIGIQVVGPYGSDYRTIRLAARLSELCGGYRPPPLVTDSAG
jgi:amidase